MYRFTPQAALGLSSDGVLPAHGAVGGAVVTGARVTVVLVVVAVVLVVVVVVEVVVVEVVVVVVAVVVGGGFVARHGTASSALLRYMA